MANQDSKERAKAMSQGMRDSNSIHWNRLLKLLGVKNLKKETKKKKAESKRKPDSPLGKTVKGWEENK